MNAEFESLQIEDVPPERRPSLQSLLEESFEGWYLSHSRKTLMSVDLVREAVVGDRPVGMVMLKTFSGYIGYVYYIAVAREYRRRKVGTRLLDHSLGYFSSTGMREVYASVEEDNEESAGLFRSRGFTKTSYREVARRYGPIRALDLYRRMLVVPGEALLFRPLGGQLEHGQATA